MQKIIALSLVFLLSGCVSPTTQMANNKFSEVQPSTPPVSGIWTISISPSISTIKLDSDGNGVLCDDTSGHVVFNKVKYANNMIYIENGMTLEVMCAEKTGGFNLVNYRHSSGVYHEQETEDLHRRI